MKKALFIDNYDSFSDIIIYYLSDYFKVKLIKNDSGHDPSIVERFDALVLSPGPGNLNDIGITPLFFKKAYSKIPVLGICLGFQYISSFYGGSLKIHDKPQHGELKKIRVRDSFLFKGKTSFEAVFYNSLYIDHDNMEKNFIVGENIDGGFPAIFEDREKSIFGTQFHPEALKSENRDIMFYNFYKSTLNKGEKLENTGK